MKKVFSIALFFALLIGVCFSLLEVNQNNQSMRELNLSQLVMINQASAEIDEDGEVEDVVSCKYTIQICDPFGVLCYSREVDGTETNCVSGKGSCWTTGLCF